MLRGALNGAYVQDGFFTAHDAPFRRDPKFREAYRLGHATGSFGKWQVEWRTFVCCWAAKRALALPGDLVECGVNRGGYSRAVAHYVDLADQPKKLWLLDTFEGLVAEQLTPEERARGVLEAARYPDCYDEVRATFAPFPNVELIKGPVPDTLARVTSETISYLSIDMNCAAPEIAAAEHFCRGSRPARPSFSTITAGNDMPPSARPSMPSPRKGRRRSCRFRPGRA